MAATKLDLPLMVARRSSHLSRVARLFAAELGIEVELRPVLNLMSEDSDDYGGHPSLKVPVLRLNGEPCFGALNICRRLWQHSGERLEVLWPEQMSEPLLVNALEIVLNGMGSEVTIVMERLARAATGSDEPPSASARKARASLLGGLGWLESRLPGILDALPAKPTLSYLEVCLFCFADHLEWREVLSLDAFPRLRSFRDEFAQRPSAQATAFRFDA